MASPPPITNGIGSGFAISSDSGAVVLTVFDPEAFESVKRFVNVLVSKELAAVTRLKDAKKKGLLEAARRESAGSGSTFDANAVNSSIDGELGGAYLPQCLEEIKTRLVIKSHPIYAEAQETWAVRKREFTDHLDWKQKNVSKVTNNIYELIGVLNVSQGVLYTDVSQSSLLHCNNWWSPISLSVAASVNVVVGIIDKLLRIPKFQSIIHSAVQS